MFWSCIETFTKKVRFYIDVYETSSPKHSNHSMFREVFVESLKTFPFKNHNLVLSSSVSGSLTCKISFVYDKTKFLIT